MRESTYGLAGRELSRWGSFWEAFAFPTEISILISLLTQVHVPEHLGNHRREYDSIPLSVAGRLGPVHLILS